MIPTRRLVWLAAVGIPFLLLALFDAGMVLPALVYTAALAAFAVVDWSLAARLKRFEVRRLLPDRWVLRRGEPVTLLITRHGFGRGRLIVRDRAPSSFRIDPEEIRLPLPADGRTAHVEYRATATRRGRPRFGPVAMRSHGPLSLMARQHLFHLDDRVDVLPDMVSLSAREARLIAPSPWLAGRRRGRLAGEGRDFHQLREYSRGDDVRSMDWKAFARRGHPIVRDYRPERNQRILILLDAGRLMTVAVGDRLRFDWAVEAAGRLTRVALAMGDMVGVTVFGRDILGRVPAARGASQLGKVADLLRDARPGVDEPNLVGALHALVHRHVRRSLVVLFTELSDPAHAETVVRHVGALSPRHLALVVTLADTGIENEREVALEGPEDPFRRAAAEELWQDYQRSRRSLEERGVRVVRARADALAAEAVERYVEIKRRGRL